MGAGTCGVRRLPEQPAMFEPIPLDSFEILAGVAVSTGEAIPAV